MAKEIRHGAQRAVDAPRRSSQKAVRHGPDRIPAVLYHLEKHWAKNPEQDLHTIIRKLGPNGTKGRYPTDLEIQEKLYADD